MEILWFWIIAFMLTMYVILDGFDIGAGIIHLIIAKTEEERSMIINAIGPVWDGNEVWLLSTGGSLFLAFPLLYASSFSGFYLPLMIVLWLFMLRALGIEFRHHVQNPIWKTFWDTSFSISSILLAIFFGAALGNIIRGVPLDQTGYFFVPLWTTFTVVPQAGVLDWFTVTMGLVALFTLTTHGANYVALKTSGDLQIRARSIAFKGIIGVVILSIIALGSVITIRPEVLKHFTYHTFGSIFLVLAVIGVDGMIYFNRKQNDLLAFLSSTIFIAGTLGGTAFGMFPNVLPASTGSQYNLTVYNTLTNNYGLSVGIAWWIIGIILTAGYFIFVYRIFHGKVKVESEGY